MKRQERRALRCRRCGEPLEPTWRADRIYCSGRCRVAAHRAAQAAAPDIRADADGAPDPQSLPRGIAAVTGRRQ